MDVTRRPERSLSTSATGRSSDAYTSWGNQEELGRTGCWGEPERMCDRQELGRVCNREEELRCVGHGAPPRLGGARASRRPTVRS